MHVQHARTRGEPCNHGFRAEGLQRRPPNEHKAQRETRCKAGGKPSTWFPPGGLAEGLQERNPIKTTQQNNQQVNELTQSSVSENPDLSFQNQENTMDNLNFQ